MEMRIKRRVNTIKRKLFISQQPHVLHIEINNTCNLHCIMCPRERMNRKPGIMNFETYRKIIDDTASIVVPHVRLFMFGEPLLHPKLIEMIKYAKSKNIPKVDFKKNAPFIKKNISREIIVSVLDRFFFYFEGINKIILSKPES